MGGGTSLIRTARKDAWFSVVIRFAEEAPVHEGEVCDGAKKSWFNSLFAKAFPQVIEEVLCACRLALTGANFSATELQKPSFYSEVESRGDALQSDREEKDAIKELDALPTSAVCSTVHKADAYNASSRIATFAH